MPAFTTHFINICNTTRILLKLVPTQVVYTAFAFTRSISPWTSVTSNRSREAAKVQFIWSLFMLGSETRARCRRRTLRKASHKSCGRPVHQVVTDSRKQARRLQRAARSFPSPASRCRQTEEPGILPWISCEKCHLWYTPNSTCLLHMKRANTDVRSLDIPMPQNTSLIPGNIVYVERHHSFKVLFF